MKKRIFLPILICITILSSMVLTGCKPAAVVVAKVGTETITSKDVDLYVNYLLLGNGQTRADITNQQDMADLNKSALEMAVDYKIIMQKATEKKLSPLSAADAKTVDDTITQYIKQRLDPLVTSYTDKAKTDPSIVDATKSAQKDLDSQMKAEGLTKADLTQLLTMSKVAELLMNEANKSITVTDDEVKAAYDQLVASKKTSYTSDPNNYETDVSNGTTIVYKPEGYRYVKHILIAFPQDISTQISTAQSSGDTATVKKLRDDNLPKIKAKADEVLSKVTGGGDFDALMAQYGEDPGMKQEPTSKTGYELGSATSFVEEFKDAALKLAKVGDVTSLVATDYGYHIIKWVGNVPSGPVSYDLVKDSLKTEALTTKQNDSWNAQIEQWKTELKVEQYPEKIPVLLPSAAVSPTTAAK